MKKDNKASKAAKAFLSLVTTHDEVGKMKKAKSRRWAQEQKMAVHNAISI